VWDNQGTHGISPSSHLFSISAEYSCIQHLPQSYGNSNIDANPQFDSPGHWALDTWIAGDYHLKAISPCIDASPDAGVAIDLEGVERPFDHPLVNSGMTLYDIGAYEAVSIPRIPVSLQITGPAEVGRYSQVQYQASVFYEDGSSQEVGSLVNWSLDTAVFSSIDSEGILTIGNSANDRTITLSASYTENDTTVNGSLEIAYTRNVHTFYVDALHGSDQNDGTSIQEAFATIRKGIQESDKNFVVVVYPGVYRENVHFQRKEITVTSVTPEELDCVMQTRIVTSGRAVTVSTSRLIGLSIESDDTGVFCDYTDTETYSPVIKHCYIRSPTGIDIHAPRNHAGNGPLIENNIIVSDWKGIYLFYYSDFDGVVQSTIRNNVIFGDGSSARIGIQYRRQYEQPDVRSNIISNFEYGIEFTYTNLIQQRKDRIRYNNVWGNVHNYWCDRLDSEFDLTGLQGNISNDPQFADASNHVFRPGGNSPCINAGDPDFVPAPGETDMDGNPRVLYGVVDMGAYEFSNTAPVAHAGSDLQVFAGVGGTAEVELDGSGSDDVDGQELTYSWTWEVDGQVTSASGIRTVVEFGRREYVLSLVVNDGFEDSLADEVVVRVLNVAPVADAGEDATVYAWIDGVAEVALDGSASSDDNGDELSYRWLLDGAEITVGVSPLIELPVGEHLVELVVSDGWDEASDTVVVEVVGPIETSVRVVPRAINRKTRGRTVLAVMQLPEGVDGNEIDKGYGVVFEPGGVQARLWRVLVGKGEGSLFAMFDRDKIIDALDDEGNAQVNVVCRLVSGRYLYGVDKLKVIDNGNGPKRRVPRRTDRKKEGPVRKR